MTDPVLSTTAIWRPPVGLFRAGRETVCSRAYRNDARRNARPRRILFKRTLEGAGTLYVRGRPRSVPAGWAFALERPGPYVYAYEGDGAPWRFAYVTVELDAARPILPAALREEPLFCLEAFPELDARFRDLVERRLGGASGGDLADSAAAYRFLLEYAAARTQESPGEERTPAAQLKRLLEERFAQNASVESLAAELGYAPETLIRAFRRQYGTTPGRYAQWLRVRQACRLLETGSLPLKRVAAACGFSDANYFGRAFRRLVGVPPGAYRRNPDPLRAGLP